MEKIDKKYLGQFFTPIEIVDYILDISSFSQKELSGFSTKKILELKIGDISCGEGIFLVEVYKRLVKAVRKRDDLEKELTKIGYNDYKKFILEKIIYGVDIDSTMIEKTRNNLLVESGLQDKAISLNLIVKNSLLVDLFKNLKFDYLFGNPPYSKKINEKDKKSFFELYKESIGGHPNLCTLFIHKSINILKEEGILGYLVSAPYLSAYYHRNLRKMIVDKTEIKQILRFEDRKGVVEGILQELSIIVFKRKDFNDDYFLTASVTKDKKTLVQKKISNNKIKFSKFLHNHEYNREFLIAKNILDYKIVEKMRNKGNPLKSFADVHTGEIVKFRSKNHIKKTPDKSYFPLINIEFVKPFQLIEDIQNIFYKPKKAMQYIHNGKLILIKRLTSKEQPKRVIASIVNMNGYTIDNKLNFIEPKNEEELYILVGLLNSYLLYYFFRLFSSNTQVSSNELRFLPIILDKKVGEITKKIIIRKEDLLDDLNERIFEIYGLSNEEKENIICFYK